MKSSELMKMAEDGLIEKGRIVVDGDGCEFIFTGKSFQLYDSDKVELEKYYGLCVGDNWQITDYEICDDDEISNT